MLDRVLHILVVTERGPSHHDPFRIEVVLESGTELVESTLEEDLV